MIRRISDLPTRFEPLFEAFGEKATSTFIPQDVDIKEVKKLIVRAESSRQSKVLFLLGESGKGKTTFIHSISTFLSDKVSSVARLPDDTELSTEEIPDYIANIEVGEKFTILNFDGRESPFFDQKLYQTFLGRLNAILRKRKDLIVIWPVNDVGFANSMVELLKVVGGLSPFGQNPIYALSGIKNNKFLDVLKSIMVIANWQLADAAIEEQEIQKIADGCKTIGSFLDEVQQLISDRFDLSSIGIEIPEVVFAISSGAKEIRELCRNVRRADSYYVEASRLLMYTKQSNVAEWWAERNKNTKTALPYIISLLNAQLVSVSGSSVVHSVQNFGDVELKAQISGVQQNLGNAKKVIGSSELFKYSVGQDLDSREYGSAVKDETIESYRKIQELSKKKHKEINNSILKLVESAEGGFSDTNLEVSEFGLIVDAKVTRRSDGKVKFLEFHHKSIGETTNSKLAVYILEKLKEYSVNLKLATR